MKNSKSIALLVLVVILLGFGAFTLLDAPEDSSEPGEPFDEPDAPSDDLVEENEEIDQVIVIDRSFYELTEEDIINALTGADIPIGEVTYYTEETCPDNLLGMPEQYVGKAVWEDTRLDQTNDSGTDGSVEIFFNESDLIKRKEKMESSTDDYIYVHKNAIIYLTSELSAEQAAEYKEILQSL